MHITPGPALSIPATPSHDHARAQRVPSIAARAPTCGCLLARRRRSVGKEGTQSYNQGVLRGLLFEISPMLCGVRVEHEKVASGPLSRAETI